MTPWTLAHEVGHVLGMEHQYHQEGYAQIQTTKTRTNSLGDTVVQVLRSGRQGWSTIGVGGGSHEGVPKLECSRDAPCVNPLRFSDGDRGTMLGRDVPCMAGANTVVMCNFDPPIPMAGGVFRAEGTTVPISHQADAVHDNVTPMNALAPVVEAFRPLPAGSIVAG